MTRATRLLTALLGLAITGACSGESPTEPGSQITPRNSSASSGPITRPAGGSCTTTLVPDFSGIPSGFFTIQIAGVCKLKHLGRTTFTADQIVYIFTGDIVNTTIYTAANGDSFTSTFVGTDPTATAVFTGTETYSGGTGRFAGITGESFLSGSANVVLLTGQYTTSGWMRY